MRLLIFVVAYNAQQHITKTLDRISRDWLTTTDYKILVINDASVDMTGQLIADYMISHPDIDITYLDNDVNLGYGGNQKRGYEYAIQYNYDVVALLHGDGQYAPEYLPQMITPILDSQAELVLGSRMMDKMKALEGNMPLYKWIGNQTLTFLQNKLLSSSLTEFHTGYRAFKVDALKNIPFANNSNYFDFDTEIIIQLLDTNARTKEISIPTFYGDEISYVNGLKYAWLIMKTTIKSRLVKKKWIKDNRFIYQ